MTDKEMDYLMDLFEKHELSLVSVMSLLGIGASRTAAFAASIGDEKLEMAMSALDIDCLKFTIEKRE